MINVVSTAVLIVPLFPAFWQWGQVSIRACAWLQKDGFKLLETAKKIHIKRNEQV
jgi:hypothetical protein